MPISILINTLWNPSDGGVRTGGGLSVPQHFCSHQIKTKKETTSPKTAWGGEEERAPAVPPAQAESPGRGARAGAEAEGGQRVLGKNPRERSCPFSSRSCCGDIAGGGKHGPSHLHPGADHLPAAGGSVHLHHQVGPCRAPPDRPGLLSIPGGAGHPLGSHGRTGWASTGVCPAPCSRVTLASPRRCRYYSSLRLPLMYSHPYSQITVETEFDNPIYETGVSAAGPLAPWGLLRWLGAKGFKGFAACAAPGLWGESGQTVSGPGGLQKPWAGQGGDNSGEQRDPWSTSWNGVVVPKCSCCPKTVFPFFQETREYEVSI